ncbi:MAG: hypothetical protein B5M53_03415 [Candidatus Cloacimonas sp. 4484_209]|nr:MAG: hypothetical protein B5M53_03415 [Candidatus Cloacimonas sp. 4484_209]
MLTTEMLIISYAFLFFASLVFYIICHLSIVVLKTRKEIGKLQKNPIREENLEYCIAKQRSYFFIWLMFLKLIGLILLILCTVRAAMDLFVSFRGMELGGFVFDLRSFTYGAQEFITIHEFFLILTILPFLVHTIFNFILERRILKLRTIERK